MKKAIVLLLLVSLFSCTICVGQTKGYLSISDLKILCQLDIDAFETYVLKKGFETSLQKNDGECSYYGFNSEQKIVGTSTNSASLTFCKGDYPISCFGTPNKTYFVSLKDSFTSIGFVFTGTSSSSTKEISEFKNYQKGKHRIITYTFVVDRIVFYNIQYWIVN